MSEETPVDPQDSLATALGRFVHKHEAAEFDARPPEWEAALRGEANFDAVVEQRRAAGDPDVDRAAAYLRPFDADETDALVGHLFTAAQNEKNPDDAPVALAEVIPLAPDRAASEGPPAAPATAPVELPATPQTDPRARIWWLPGGMLAAAAAAILMWWVSPPSQDVRLLGTTAGTAGTAAGTAGTVVAQREPLPAYTLELDGGLAELRGDPKPEAGTPLRYRRDTSFSWLLRPEVDVADEVGVRGFVFVEGGSAGMPLSLGKLAQSADSGVLRITGEIEALDLERGRYTIVLAVGRPEDLPTQAEVAAPNPGGSWQVHRIEITIED